MFKKIKNYNSIYIIILLAGVVYFFLSEKNVVILLQNKNQLQEKAALLNKKLTEKEFLENKIDKFKNSEEFKELIIKEKLFLKQEDDKLIFYELDN
ncbi:MAG: hypothetical protein CMP43_02405 [Rickettsiales bacterium]|nr:hypothetical protein [Rickettsiales bacterium]|tara:strand:+ start:361 stop:648 length:288 start_codon:yes stop_codon:yes gene_type:complete